MYVVYQTFADLIVCLFTSYCNAGSIYGLMNVRTANLLSSLLPPPSCRVDYYICWSFPLFLLYQPDPYHVPFVKQVAHDL